MIYRSIICAILAWGFLAAAESTPSDFSELSIEELMNVKISVASAFQSKRKDAPGIISVFTSDDILASGANHLSELIQQIPGFQLQDDVGEITTIGFRGTWAGEGKILVTIDHIPINDLGYSGVQLTDNIPLSMIDRIEVIRGPGSVVHGGLSEFAVIAIETKSHSTMKAFEAGTTIGEFASGGTARRSVTLGAAHGFSENSGFSAYFNGSRYHRSDSTYANSNGESADISSHSDDNIGGGFKFQSGGFKFNSFYSDYNIKNQQVGYDTPLASQGDTRFLTFGNYAEFKQPIGTSAVLKPFLIYRENTPFKNNATTPGTNSYYYKKFYEVNPGLILTYEPSETNAFSLGAEYKYSHGQKMVDDDAGFYDFYIGGQPVKTQDRRSTSIFGEILLRRPIGNFSAGLRYEKSDCCSPATVPRLAYTKNFDAWNFKALASMAYRTPGQENFNYAGDPIAPEKSQTYEVEVAREIQKNSHISINAFYLKLVGPIIYNYTAGQDGYDNGKDIATYGTEIEYKFLSGKWNNTLSYSYSQPESKFSNSAYQTDKNKMGLGLSNHKATGKVEYKLTRATVIGSSATYFSERRVFRDNGGAPIYTGLPSYTDAALWFSQNNLFVRGISATVGASNIFNANNSTAMAYYADGSILGDYPKRGSELFLRLGYKADF